VCREHELLDKRLVLSITGVTVHRSFYLDHDDPDSHKNDVHAHQNNDNVELLQTPGRRSPDFNLAVPGRNTLPNVNCAEEGITVNKSDSTVDHNAHPQEKHGPPNSIPTVSDAHAHLFEHHLYSNHKGSEEPASVDRHAESEHDRFKNCELGVERSFLHDERSGHQCNHDQVCTHESRDIISQEHWQPEGVKEQISAKPPANLVEDEIIGSGSKASTTFSRQGLVDHEDEKENVDDTPDSYPEGSWCQANIHISRDPSKLVRHHLGSNHVEHLTDDKSDHVCDLEHQLVLCNHLVNFVRWDCVRFDFDFDLG